MQYTKITIDPKLTQKADFDDQNKVRLSAESGPDLVVKGKTSLLKITCRDLASTAWGIYTNGIFFRHKFGIDARYRQDINGGGAQLVEIGRGGVYDEMDCTIRVIFSRHIKSDWIYEADLMMDGRKDYHPTRNLGKTKFGAEFAQINITDPEELLAWINGSYVPWVRELSRISKPHSTLLEWVESGLNMGVRCSDFFCENEVKVIPNNDLKKYLTSGATLENLREKLACSKCGRSRPRVAPF